MRRAIRVFLLIRDLVLTLSEERESQLPLTDRTTCIPVGTSLDLSKCLKIKFYMLNQDRIVARCSLQNLHAYSKFINLVHNANTQLFN